MQLIFATKIKQGLRGALPVPSRPAEGRNIRRVPEGGQVDQALADPAAQEPRQHERWEQQPAAAGQRQWRQPHWSTRELRRRRRQRGATLSVLGRAQVAGRNLNDHMISMITL